MTRVLIAIPAAGASSRMRGADKLMQKVGGVPLLARQTERALATGYPVFVTVSKDHPVRQTALPQHANLRIEVIDGAEGMSLSLRRAIARAGDAEGLMVHLPDMPDLETQDLTQMIGAFAAAPDQVHRAASSVGHPGHPVIFPHRLFAALSNLSGDTGGKEILKTEEVRLHPLPGQRALTDLDTPEAWAAWLAQR